MIVGSETRCEVKFADTAGQLADPTTITFHLRTPSGVETAHVFGVDSGVTRDSRGVYHFDLPLSEPGLWAVRWVGTGAIIAATERQFVVDPSAFVNP